MRGRRPARSEPEKCPPGPPPPPPPDVQVHDEVILEGPRGPVSPEYPHGETAAKARALVVKHMENPWGLRGMVGGMPLRVKLETDSKIADTWFEAK